MQRLRVALCLVLLVLLGACGDEPKATVNVAGLEYVPRDAFVAAIVPTDLQGEQLQRLDRLIEPALREGDAHSLRDVLASFFEDGEIDFARDVEPLLGKDMVVAAWGDPDDPLGLIALETPDGAKARALVRKLDLHEQGRVDGDLLLIRFDGHGEAIQRPREAFDAAAFDDEDALVRVAGDPRALTKALEVDVDLPWIQALERASATVRLGEDEITAQAHVSTRPDDLDDEDLPLASGDDAPQAGDVGGAINSANRDQSRTTVFLAQLARKAYPDSEFVAQVDSVEADLGISFEDEVLEQFNGPSASVARPDGSFAAVSGLDDPERMRELLPRLAPRLPDVLCGLQSLGNRGLIALLLIAPDAPLVPGTLPLLSDGIDVRRIPGGDLYELTGLDEGSKQFRVPRVVFGMIGDRFVVATDERRARDAAEMEVSDVEDAHGGAVARTDFSTWDSDPLGLETVPLGEAVGELEASREGIDARLRVPVPGGLDG
jgi:hypothetical protein